MIMNSTQIRKLADDIVGAWADMVGEAHVEVADAFRDKGAGIRQRLATQRQGEVVKRYLSSLHDRRVITELLFTADGTDGNGAAFLELRFRAGEEAEDIVTQMLDIIDRDGGN